MAGRSAKFTQEQNGVYQGEIAVILAESQEALTIEQIQEKSITLTGLSNQKMARLLSHLIEMGMVTKARSRSQGKMVYKSLAVMEEQGYDISQYKEVV